MKGGSIYKIDNHRGVIVAQSCLLVQEAEKAMRPILGGKAPGWLR